MARGSTIVEVTLLQIERVAHDLAQQLMDWGEPIPAFNTRFPDRLESCLKTPFQKFDRKSLYPGLIAKASALFYFMIKNHPFQNGNKRVAVMTLFYFLYKNGWWLNVTNDSLYEFANEVAKSKPQNRDKVMKEIRSYIRKYLSPIGDDLVAE